MENSLFKLIFTSSIVSGIVTFILRIYFEKKHKHKMDKELENFKLEKNKVLEEFKIQLIEDRDEKKEIKDILDKINSFIADGRRAAKDSIDNIFDAASYFDALNGAKVNIESMLDNNGRILRQVNIFFEVHDFKNTIVTYKKQLQNLGTDNDKNTCLNVLRQIYENIFQQYQTITKRTDHIINDLYSIPD